jgi:aminoglycoside phosphotransferase (APT) family kinase protein
MTPDPETETAIWRASLQRMGLAGGGAEPRVTPLTGGVSSDIVRVDLPHLTLCVKRALPRLKVAADWRAPIARNRYELLWLRTVAAIAPGQVPAIVGDDPEGGAFAMEWLAPDAYPVWKTLLRDGAIEAETAAAVGDILGRIHAATADRADLAAAFATDAIFYPIRLEPYLIATGARHPDLAARLTDLAALTRRTRRVLVHGDWSPKNILIGPRGPVALDAECAWYGDPAFDMAFVLNHLLLKGVWQPQWRMRYVDALTALTAAYRMHVTWEPWTALEARIAGLLPGLMLGRVDGRSPAEYLTDERDKDKVRRFARAHLASPVADLATLAARWHACRLEARPTVRP